MIVLYVGRRGSGKTTTMIKDAYTYKGLGWRVFTNMTSVSFADAVLSIEDILALLEGDETDIVVMLDEIQTFIDSRRSMRKRNVDFTYYIQQIRKRNVIILATTQFARRVDLAFREHVDILAKPSFLEEYPLIVVSYQDMTVMEEDFYGSGVTGVRSVVFDPRQVYDLFDTTETVKPGV